MIQELKVVNSSGEELTIDLARPEESGFAIRSITGLGPVKANINMTDLAIGDGSLYNSSKTSYRNIVIDLIYYPVYQYVSQMEIMSQEFKPPKKYDTSKIPGSEFIVSPINASIESLRQMSYRYFPVKQPIKLFIKTSNRHVWINGYVESNEPDIFNKDEGATISIICPNPYFYGVGEESIYTQLKTVTPKFEFPDPDGFSNESLDQELIEMGDLQLTNSTNITYDGDIETGVILEVVFNSIPNNLNPLSITNRTQNSSMSLNIPMLPQLTQRSIQIGDKLVISSISRNKFIKFYDVNGAYKDGLNVLSIFNREWGWLVLKKGHNYIFYNGLGDSIDVSISYPKIYGGI